MLSAPKSVEGKDGGNYGVEILVQRGARYYAASGAFPNATAAEILIAQVPSSDNSFSGIVSIRSEIKKRDFDTFERMTTSAAVACDQVCAFSPKCKDFCSKNLSVLVDLDSPGGDVIEAMRIGRLIHQRFMNTSVLRGRQCASACVFMLQAGVVRIPAVGSRVGLHRPKFDAAYFADLTPDQARRTYEAMVGNLRKYFIGEMGGSDEAFRLIMTTPSDQLRVLTYDEMVHLGLNGIETSYDEYNDAQMVKKYGQARWSFIKACVGSSADLDGCEKRAYSRYPADK